ncbi:MAG TPA: hypothetical protein VGL53_28775 [Bryobacteraceae bacterium]|jgi:hypothetical protein
MGTQNVIHISAEILAELRTKAAAEGKTVDEFAEDALRKGLEERSWQDLIAYGRERGHESGYAEDDIVDVVRNNRLRNR